jgi:hypothetical protein
MKKHLHSFEQELVDFFDFANPEEWETLLWQWFKTTIAGSYNKCTVEERSKLIDTYEMINRMIKKMGDYSQKE